MSKLHILILSLTLSGCLWQTVNQYDMSRATELCKQQNSEVIEIYAYMLGDERALCSNGKVMRWN